MSKRMLRHSGTGPDDATFVCLAGTAEGVFVAVQLLGERYTMSPDVAREIAEGLILGADTLEAGNVDEDGGIDARLATKNVIRMFAGNAAGKNAKGKVQ